MDIAVVIITFLLALELNTTCSDFSCTMPFSPKAFTPPPFSMYRSINAIYQLATSWCMETVIPSCSSSTFASGFSLLAFYLHVVFYDNLREHAVSYPLSCMESSKIDPIVWNGRSVLVWFDWIEAGNSYHLYLVRTVRFQHWVPSSAHLSWTLLRGFSTWTLLFCDWRLWEVEWVRGWLRSVVIHVWTNYYFWRVQAFKVLLPFSPGFFCLNILVKSRP